MTELVWISDWQIQCCGSECAVGDEVTWPVYPRDTFAGNTWVALVGEEIDAAITGTYDSHEDEPLPMMTGVVRRIRTVTSHYAAAPPPADPRERWPVPGTGVIEDVTAIEKWYGADFDRDVLVFSGWLVDLVPTA